MRLTTLSFMVTLGPRAYKLATSCDSGFCLACRRDELHVVTTFRLFLCCEATEMGETVISSIMKSLVLRLFMALAML
jgi:hypothetical protein